MQVVHEHSLEHVPLRETGRYGDGSEEHYHRLARHVFAAVRHANCRRTSIPSTTKPIDGGVAPL